MQQQQGEQGAQGKKVTGQAQGVWRCSVRHVVGVGRPSTQRQSGSVASTKVEREQVGTAQVADQLAPRLTRRGSCRAGRYRPPLLHK